MLRKSFLTEDTEKNPENTESSETLNLPSACTVFLFNCTPIKFVVIDSVLG